MTDPEDDPFESPKILLERAEENVRELQTRAKAFFDGKPYTDVVELDPETGEDIYKLRFTAKIPKGLNAVAADALNNLRATLDQAICTSASLLVPGVNLNGMGFPFAATEAAMEDAIRSKCKNVPPEIVALVRSLKPYKGGNDLRWALSKLSATNRHRTLITDVGASTDSMYVHQMTFSGPGSIPAPIWDRANHELAVARITHGAKLQYDVEFSFFVAFGDVEVVGGQPTLPILGQMGTHVVKALNAIRFETLSLLKAKT